LILVIGASGFVGRHLMARLSERDAPIRALVPDARAAQTLRSSRVQSFAGRAATPDLLERVLEGVDTIIHVAVSGLCPDQATGWGIREPEPQRIVAAARAAGVRHILYVSSLGARDDPRHPYHRGQWLGEQAVIAGGVPFAILRPSLVVAPGEPFFTMLATLIGMAPCVPLPDGNGARQQPIAVHDLCSCLLTMLDNVRYLGAVHDVGGPEHVNLREMAEIVMRVLGRRRPIVPVPGAAARRAVALLATLAPGMCSTFDLPPGDLVAATDALPRLFGVEKPTRLQAALDYLRR
jgi:NADH dehydrogenase